MQGFGTSNTLVLGILPNGNVQPLSLDSTNKLKTSNSDPVITFDGAGYVMDQAGYGFDGVHL